MFRVPQKGEAQHQSKPQTVCDASAGPDPSPNSKKTLDPQTIGRTRAIVDSGESCMQTDLPFDATVAANIDPFGGFAIWEPIAYLPRAL